MTDIEQEFADHPRFERVDERSESTERGAGSEATRERVDGAFVPTTIDWDAEADVEDGEVAIEVTLPTLDAVTEDDVADVVEDGWYDTFERRVVDADSVTLATNVDVTSVDREGGEIIVEIRLTPRSGKAADDALALINFAEGTWFEGIIPGYDYTETVQEMRQRAAQNADGSKSGTPL